MNPTIKHTNFIFFCLAAVFVNRLAFIVFANPIQDEAYYWLWGQNLQLSYYDHPPLHSYIQRIFYEIFGISNFALRVSPILFSLVAIASSVWWLRTIYTSTNWKEIIVTISVIFFCPQFNTSTLIAINDYLLIALLSVSAIYTYKVLHSIESNNDLVPSHLYIAALACGLAILTKYNALIFLICIFFFVLLDKRYRRIFRYPHTYGSLLVVLACVLPIFIWNYQNNFESISYNFSDRLEDGISIAGFLVRILNFLVDCIRVYSPFLCVVIYFIARNDYTENSRLSLLRRMSLFIFAGSIIICIFFMQYTDILSYWNVVGYIPIVFLCALIMRNRWVLLGHVVYGTISAILVTINFTLFPIADLFDSDGSGTRVLYGWHDVNHVTDELGKKYPDYIRIASNYRIGSIWAYTSKNPNIDVLSERESQFTLWMKEREYEYEGRNAIILVDEWHPMTNIISSKFKKVEALESIDISRFGYHITGYMIYLGYDYLPPAE